VWLVCDLYHKSHQRKTLTGKFPYTERGVKCSECGMLLILDWLIG
jgi:hypothetical protein